MGKLNFKNVELTDKEWIDQLLSFSQFQGTEYCFTSLFIWAKIYNTTISRYKDMLIVRSIIENGAQYLFPAGNYSDEELREVISLMDEDSADLGMTGYLGSIDEASVGRMNRVFPGKYRFSQLRFTADYIYLASDLINLPGKNFQAKRNHLNRFKAMEGWKYEAIDKSNLDECLAMTDEWCKVNYCIHNLSMQDEACATRKAIRNFEQLRLKGGLIRMNGKVIAYSIGEQLNNDTFIVHIEKAFSEYNGIYQAINHDFIEHEASDMKFVNREDDANEESLRKAKLSYNPVYLLEKYYTAL